MSTPGLDVVLPRICIHTAWPPRPSAVLGACFAVVIAPVADARHRVVRPTGTIRRAGFARGVVGLVGLVAAGSPTPFGTVRMLGALSAKRTVVSFGSLVRATPVDRWQIPAGFAGLRGARPPARLGRRIDGWTGLGRRPTTGSAGGRLAEVGFGLGRAYVARSGRSRDRCLRCLPRPARRIVCGRASSGCRRRATRAVDGMLAAPAPRSGHDGVDHRRLGRDALARRPRLAHLGHGLRGRSTVGDNPLVPADHADHQHDRRRDEHQRKALDQRIAAIDEDVLEAADLAGVKQEVGAGNRKEEDQRWLDGRGEDTGLTDCQNGQETASDVTHREDGTEFLVAGARVECEANGGRRRGQQDGSPPGDSWHARQR
jgi:hypothetical protein